MVVLPRINFNFKFPDFAPVGYFGIVDEWKIHKRGPEFSQKKEYKCL